MTKDITVDVSEWERFADAAKNNREAFDKHAKNAMDGSLDYVMDLLVSETPVGVSGNLRAGWGKEIHGANINLTGEVANSLLYGLPVDQGRKAVQHPSREAIQSIALWVKRKGLAGDPDEAVSIAWAIARSPTTGAHMVDKAYQDATSGDEIERIWHYELERYIEELLP